MQLTATKSTTDLRTGKTDRRTVTLTPEAYFRYCKIALARAKADPERIFVALDSVSLRIYTDEVFMELASPPPRGTPPAKLHLRLAPLTGDGPAKSNP